MIYRSDVHASVSDRGCGLGGFGEFAGRQQFVCPSRLDCVDLALVVDYVDPIADADQRRVMHAFELLAPEFLPGPRFDAGERTVVVQHEQVVANGDGRWYVGNLLVEFEDDRSLFCSAGRADDCRLPAPTAGGRYVDQSASEYGRGDGLEGDEIASFWGVNADATGDSSSLSVTEAWYEHMYMNDMVAFTIGKLDLSNYFDGNEVANDETTQFLSGGFVNDITIDFPDNSAGLRVTVSPMEMLDVSLGIQSEEWEDLDEENFIIAEADVKLKFGELQGNYRFYIWHNRNELTDASDAGNTNEEGTGFGTSIDQQVVDFLTLFARLGFRNDDIVEYQYDAAWSLGGAVSGSLWGRDDDVAGAAFGQAILASSYKDTLDDAGTDSGNESHYEMYYNLVLNDHVTISPDIQIVMNAEGDDDYQTVWIGAIRGQFTF